MQTIAFYSYKGGVGRSLLVANAARFLGMLGKGVVALDLDFEAPGLHYKLGRAPDIDGKSPSLTGGAVPYLVATAKGAKNPPPLQDHMVQLALPEGTKGWLRLMPAGPAPRREYWVALKQLRERLRFDDPSGKGLAALLDLHARIRDELQPDYLLIDARTGVTELGGLATTALADCVVCLLVRNQESVDGTLSIVRALKAVPRLPGLSPVRVVPVLARATESGTGEGRTAEGIEQLVKMGEGRDTGEKGKLKPFVLPHDSVLGVTEKVVGGEQKASTFSPLHQAYLELFEHVFPQERKEADQVLRHLGSVARLRESLRERRRRRFGSWGAFAPWEDSAIEEGVLLKSRGTAARYADLVCRGRGGDLLVVAEFIPESKESEALEHWKEHSPARCVILLCQQSKSESVNRRIYCRSGRWGDLRVTQRYDPPLPKEFDIFSDLGKQSIEEMLDAVHRGDEEMVPEVISRWQECMAAVGMPERHRPWRPVEARKILDGLAAAEKIETAVRILQHTARISSRKSEFDEFAERHGVSGLAALTEHELFAPLFWRLPAEAAIRYLGEPDSPFWTPCVAGYRFLAEDVMGLRYDPLRSALKEADFLAAQVPADRAEGDDEGERSPHRIHQQFYDRCPVLCEDPPPLLLWYQQLRKDEYWSGESVRISEEAHDAAKKLIAAAPVLRAWLREKVTGGALVTGNLLGRYDPSACRLALYPAILDALAPLLGIQPRPLKSVVFIQLSVHAMAHQARDLDGQPGFGFALASTASPFQRESPGYIALSQYFACRLIERLGDSNLMGAFEKLSDKQPEPYRRWRRMRRIPVEQMRTALLRARLAEAALGLPGAEPEG